MPVTLRIRRPRHGQIFVGEAGPVVFEGEEVARDAASEAETMYFRWYSSQHATAARYSLHDPPLTRAEQVLRRSLCVGTHAIVLAAMNRPSDRPGIFETITDGGVTGGTAGDGACVVHVIRARLFDIRADVAGPDGASIEPREVSPGDAFVAVADGPIAWKDFEPGFEGLRYRYRLRAEDDALPAHVFDAAVTFGEQAGPGGGDDPGSVAYSRLVVPPLEGDEGWTVDGPRAVHAYDRLTLELWHVADPSRVHRDSLPITVFRALLAADEGEDR